MASTAACATPVPQGMLDQTGPTMADSHRIEVRQAGERLEISAANGALTPESGAGIDAFGRSYRDGGHGPLIISTPTGAGDATNAALVAQATRLRLTEGGVEYASIIGSTYDASGQATAPVVLSYTHYTAEGPDCQPLWKYDLTDNQTNQPQGNFGCFLNANLAAMIGDPGDLVEPRPIDARDGARRAVVMDKYRNGEPTGASRSSDERVAISEAVR
jgi:pilus assembly protein CpaD